MSKEAVKITALEIGLDRRMATEVGSLRPREVVRIRPFPNAEGEQLFHRETIEAVEKLLAVRDAALRFVVSSEASNGKEAAYRDLLIALVGDEDPSRYVARGQIDGETGAIAWEINGPRGRVDFPFSLRPADRVEIVVYRGQEQVLREAFAAGGDCVIEKLDLCALGTAAKSVRDEDSAIKMATVDLSAGTVKTEPGFEEQPEKFDEATGPMPTGNSIAVEE